MIFKSTINNKTEETPEKTKIVHLIQYLSWDDHKVPENTSGVFKLFDIINEFHLKDLTMGPIVVHCAAGIGRTGTFITAHIFDERMKFHVESKSAEKQFDYNIYNVVKELKRHRIGMVQQKEQYAWCYKVVQEEAKKYNLPMNKDNANQ